MKICISVILFIFLLGCDSKLPKEGETHPKLVFRLAIELNSTTKLWDASYLFKRELEKASPQYGIEEGEIKVEFYDQGMIGTERQLLEACYFGVVEVVQINSSVVSTLEPQFSILDLPYVFVNEQHLKDVLYGDIGKELLDKLQDNRLFGLGFYTAGFRNIFYQSDNGCASTPEELKGLKIRVMESPVMVNSINAIGLRATPIPFSELYQALTTGVVDGAENSANVFVSYRYHETGCNCFTLTEHFTNQHILIANADWLESIEPKYQKRIKYVARKIIPEFDLIWDKAIQQSFSLMQQNGVTINPVKNKVDFINKVEEIPNQFFNDHPEVSRDIYFKIQSLGDIYLQK